MISSSKHRLYLLPHQEEIFDRNRQFLNDVYNCALEERISWVKYQWKTETDKKYISNFDQNLQVKNIRKAFPEENETIFARSIYGVLDQLDKAFQNFIGRVAAGKTGKAVGFPRFKPISRFHSILFPQCDLKTGGVKLLDNSKIRVFGLGDVKVIWNGQDIKLGTVKNARIIKASSGKYYLIITAENIPNKPLPKTGNIIGYDYGLIDFITDQYGNTTKHPKPYATAKEKLAYQQRKLALKQKNSKNYKKIKKTIAKTHEKTVNIREHFQHNLANKLVRENDIIFGENLNISDMLDSDKEHKLPHYISMKGLRRNISDAAWGKFDHKVSYKAENAGKIFLTQDPRNSSKECSCCGWINNYLTLADRTFKCKWCQQVMDRDQNAANNILNRGKVALPCETVIQFILFLKKIVFPPKPKRFIKRKKAAKISEVIQISGS